MLDEKLVRKILRSLSKRSNIKVIAIKETQNISTMKVYEFINFLLTFGMTIDDKYKKKSKGVTFKVNIVDHKYQATHDIDDNLTEYITMLANNFIKIVRNSDRIFGNIVTSNFKVNP